MHNELFEKAVRDYYFLMDNKYPNKGSLKLVGDRYRLTGDERTILFRGVASSQKNIERQKRVAINFSNQKLLLDGYNIVFTLMNYFLGRIVFISSDGFCRDAGSLFGKIRNQSLFYQALQHM
jgi:hypothetical protein